MGSIGPCEVDFVNLNVISFRLSLAADWHKLRLDYQ
jgi:hypothetical protein